MSTQLEQSKAQRAKYERLTAEAKGKICAKCRQTLQVGFINGDHVIRCGCYPTPPTAVRPNPMGERLQGMMQNALAVQTSEDQIKSLSYDVVRTYLAPKANQVEAVVFIRLCQALQLNPFTHEAYLIKYDERAPAAFIVGVQAHIKWASRNTQYAGYEAGTIVKSGKEVIYRDGALLLDDDELVGGWCKVYRKDWQVAPRHTVTLKEYLKPSRSDKKNLWDEKPATMIIKVAICQSLRRSFPEDVGYQHDVAMQEAKKAGVQTADVDAEPEENSIRVLDVTEAKVVEEAPKEDKLTEAFGASQAADVAPESTDKANAPKTGQETPRQAVPQNIQELFTAALQKYKMSRQDVYDALGVGGINDITDYPKAWAQIVAAKEKANA